MWQLISRVNKYIVENEPWAIAGKPAEQKKLDSVLFHSAESLRLIAALAAPVIPKTALALWEQLGLEGEVADIRLNELRWNGELAGKTIRAGGVLFPRLDAKEVFEKMDEVSGRQAGVEAPPPQTSTVSAAPAVASSITIVKTGLRRNLWVKRHAKSAVEAAAAVEKANPALLFPLAAWKSKRHFSTATHSVDGDYM